MLSGELIFINTKWRTKGAGRLPLKLDVESTKVGAGKKIRDLCTPNCKRWMQDIIKPNSVEVKDVKHSALPVYLQKWKQKN